MEEARKIQEAIEVLKKYSAKRVFLFGSVAKGSSGDYSDIDLACEGLPPHEFFKVLGKLLAMPGKSIDLVDMDDVKDTVRRRIEREGKLLYEAK